MAPAQDERVGTTLPGSAISTKPGWAHCWAGCPRPRARSATGRPIRASRRCHRRPRLGSLSPSRTRHARLRRRVHARAVPGGAVAPALARSAVRGAGTSVTCGV